MIEEEEEKQLVTFNYPPKLIPCLRRGFSLDDLPSPFKLDIGCGCHYRKPLEEWVHLDFEIAKNEHVEIQCDWSNIPLPSSVVDEVYIGDVIEHIENYNITKVLCEWNRVSKIGAVIRGTTVNIDRVMRDYAANDSGMDLEHALLNMYGWGDRLGQIHYWTYTPRTLTNLFNDYGFKVEDYSDSPGPKDRQWWLVFKGIKYKDVKPNEYCSDPKWYY